jgi:ribonuclease HI
VDFVKRWSNGERWEDDIGELSASMLKEMLEMVNTRDPVCGYWNVSQSKSGKVWCDAISLAIGCVLQIEDVTVEDAAWLRKKNDGMHINLAELDAVVRGLNLAIKWNLKKLMVATDSATVNGWMKSVLTDSHNIKTHGMAEMLVRRRLSIIKELVLEYDMELSVQWVPSATNKSDVLTRVPKK